VHPNDASSVALHLHDSCVEIFGLNRFQ
jgi:hypothetical protein